MRRIVIKRRKKKEVEVTRVVNCEVAQVAEVDFITSGCSRWL
jgi:hypothetical protein